jgi:hypothetical protein
MSSHLYFAAARQATQAAAEAYRGSRNVFDPLDHTKRSLHRCTLLVNARVRARSRLRAPASAAASSINRECSIAALAAHAHAASRASIALQHRQGVQHPPIARPPSKHSSPLPQSPARPPARPPASLVAWLARPPDHATHPPDSTPPRLPNF